jgi:hypothetical protein
MKYKIYKNNNNVDLNLKRDNKSNKSNRRISTKNEIATSSWRMWDNWIRINLIEGYWRKQKMKFIKMK